MANERTYRAVCFDLDGTLLPMDIDEFMSAYFQRIAAYMVAHGLDGERFMQGLKAGTKAMAMHTDDVANKEAFWREFFSVYGITDEAERRELRQLADEFYDRDFPHIGDGFEGNPAAGRVVTRLCEKGYPVLLTTMPMFPRRAVEHRLHWAGVDPSLFERITTYENSKAVKPRLTYYAENLAALGVAGSEVLMVGNNTMEDLAFLDLGADGYLVTDWLLDPVSYDLHAVKHGSMEDFEAWVETLPPCADPVRAVESGLIDGELTMRTLDENVLVRMDGAAIDAQAEAIADAVAGESDAGTPGTMRISPTMDA